MLAYVVDAGQRRDGRRRAAGRRLLAGHRGRCRRGRRRPGATSRSRTSRAAPATRCAPRSRRCPSDVEEVLVLSGDVPLVDGADLAGRRSTARGARRRGDRPGRGRRRSTRPASAASCATTAGTVERIVEEKDATDEEREIGEINAGLYAFDAAWLRRRIGDLQPVADDRRAVPDRPRRARARGRPDRRRARRRRRRPARRGSTTAPSSPGPSGTCGCELNERYMRAGVTMLDPSTVYLDHAVELAQDVDARAQRHPARPTAVGERTRHRRRVSQIVDSAIGERLPRLGERHRALRRRATTSTIGPFSHLRPGTHVGARRGGRQLRRAQEQHASARASKQHHISYLGDADVGERRQHRRRHDHRQLRRRAQAPHDDRRRRVPRRRHDARRAGRRSARARKTGAGAVVTRDVPAGQARGRACPARIREPARRAARADAGATETAADRAPAGAEAGPRELPIADPAPRRPDPARGVLRRRRDRARRRSAAAASSSSSTRASRGARRVRRLLDDPGRFLAVSQLGLTFIGFLASAFAAVSLADGLADAARGRSASTGARPTPIALLIVTVVLALFTIVFAELVPKTLALAHAERFALVLSRRRSTSWAGSWRRSSRLLTGDHRAGSPACSAPSVNAGGPDHAPRSCG